jgi:hypothetical protein
VVTHNDSESQPQRSGDDDGEEGEKHEKSCPGKEDEAALIAGDADAALPE